jgi:glycosyltransferase involved in cell wall biosynthesis
MRVVHILKVILAAGTERHLLLLLPALQQRGVDVHLIVLAERARPMDDYLSAAHAAGIPTERLFMRRHADLTLLPRLIGRLHALRPDVVHTHLFHADLYGIPAARLAGVSTVITGRHNDDAFRRHPLARAVNRGLWALSSGGIAISDAIRAFVIDVEGAPPHKVTRVHYGLDFAEPPADARDALRAELHLPDDALLVGAVSRLIEQKGLPYALDAFAVVMDEFPHAVLLIVGDGDQRGALESQADALGLGDRVRFLGWRADIHPIMAALDVFIMPSLWEGFGLALLEAMAHGLPVIASNISALPEIVVDGETGLLVPPRDVGGLAAALRHLLADDALRAQMGVAGRARVRTAFSVDQMADATMQVYRT